MVFNDNLFNKFDTLNSMWLINDGESSKINNTGSYTATRYSDNTFDITITAESRNNTFLNLVSGNFGRLDALHLEANKQYIFTCNNINIDLEAFWYDDTGTLYSLTGNNIDDTSKLRKVFNIVTIPSEAVRLLIRFYFGNLKVGDSETFRPAIYLVDIPEMLNKIRNLNLPDSYLYNIISTNDTTDRAAEIETILNNEKCCKLGPGNYYISSINMPENSTIEGCGNSTKIYMINDIYDTAIKMNGYCMVKDLELLGSNSDISIDGNITGVISDEDILTNGTNLWQDGTITTNEETGWIDFALTNPLAAGEYILSLELQSDAPYNSYIAMFNTNDVSKMAPQNRVCGNIILYPGTTVLNITVSGTALGFRLMANKNVSESVGYTATISNVKIVRLNNNRNGIGWFGDGTIDNNKFHGIVSGCHIARFTGAGIIAQDTMTPVEHNMLISNCYINNNNVGIYFRKNAEFNKITNCTITRNYYGYLNRGGNNDITCCGIDANVIGIQCDANEGSNTGHGLIANCSINHSDNNSGYGIIVSNTGRMIINNCNIYFSKIKLEKTDGNIISNCGGGTGVIIEIIDGRCNIISSCMARSPEDFQVLLTNNTASKIVNCYTRSGVEITPTTVS